MTAEDPAPPPAAGDPAPPPPALPLPAVGATPVRRGRGAAWVGVLLAVIGILVMVVGLSLVYAMASRFSKPVALPAPVPVAPAPPPVPVVPAPPAPSAEVPTDDGVPRGFRALTLPFAADKPFAEDATAPLPIVDGRPLWGGRDTPVTITVFGDLECPHTLALLRATLGEKARRGNDLRLAFRHFPLSQHAAGIRAARHLAALHAAHGAQAFYRALAELVHSGGPLDPGNVESRLAALSPPLSPPELEAEVVKATLDADRNLGVSLFVRETPTVFVNGLRLEGFPSKPTLADVLDREHQAAHLTLASGVAPSSLYRTRTARNLLNLGSDPPPRACVRPGDSPVRGARAPLVTVVEFSEFECELCRKGSEVLRGALLRHAGEVRAAWKNFPLPQHALARRAAGFALAARKQGGDPAFFATGDALFVPGTKLDDQGLERAAARTGLDVNVLTASAGTTEHEAAIDADLALGRRFGVTGAPTYFVNGRKVPGALSTPEFEALLREELALARRVKSNGAGSVLDLVCGERPGTQPRAR